ncbi:MAG: hypothetical protein H8D23_24350, partial [Candidatus Brocadiales bacterium]|nr:hypothetical protein [Candidatus Brocadiales bacterium]
MNIIYGLIVLSVTSSLLIIVWPMIFVVGGIFLLLIIWTLVDKWLNPSKNISSHVNNPKASIEKFTPQPAVEFKSELTEILGMDSEFANLLYNSYWEINTVENLANLGTNELISIK